MMSLFGFFRSMFPAATPPPAEPAPKPPRKPRVKKQTVKKPLAVAKKKRSAK